MYNSQISQLQLKNRQYFIDFYHNSQSPRHREYYSVCKNSCITLFVALKLFKEEIVQMMSSGLS